MDATTQDRTQLEIEKLQAEIERLKLEVHDLRLPRWQKPAYLSVIVPVLLALVALIAGALSGFFDSQREQLKAQNAELRSARAELQRGITESSAELQALKKSLQDLRQNTQLIKYVTALDASQIPQEIIDALPTTRDQRMLGPQETLELAKKLGLADLPQDGQIYLTGGDITWWQQQGQPAWRVTIEFLARRMVRAEAVRQKIKIPDAGEWSNWARPIYPILLEVAQTKWNERK